MHTVRAFITVSLTTLVTCALLAQTPPPTSRTRTLLAVFAHPDDETMAGPLLAHYAHQPGVTVQLAVATNGENGVTPFAGIPAGDQLAAVRVQETQCAAAALGAKPPILLGFPDGGLNQTAVLAELATTLTKTLKDVSPDAIITWGPEGGYGHPDHRLISAVVTQIVQAGDATPNLYYAALPKSGLRPELLAGLKFPSPFRPVADELLNVRVPYSRDAAAKARTALACHKSQFTAATMEQLTSLTEQINRGIAYLRSWNGGKPRESVF
ncbi:MAG: PIG-L family deacetylase [Acidobacteria bacterium]|nr:PIG-L family deacetylase [Acidobacteriota bacterium]